MRFGGIYIVAREKFKKQEGKKGPVAAPCAAGLLVKSFSSCCVGGGCTHSLRPRRDRALWHMERVLPGPFQAPSCSSHVPWLRTLLLVLGKHFVISLLFLDNEPPFRSAELSFSRTSHLPCPSQCLQVLRIKVSNSEELQETSLPWRFCLWCFISLSSTQVTNRFNDSWCNFCLTSFSTR